MNRLDPKQVVQVLAREAVEVLGPSLLPRGFAAKVVPKWSADLGGRRAK